MFNGSSCKFNEKEIPFGVFFYTSSAHIKPSIHLLHKAHNRSSHRRCSVKKVFSRYTNGDQKICQYLRLHMKILCWRFHIKASFTFWDMRSWDMWKVCLQTFRNNSICWNLAYFLGNLLALRANNSTILKIKNAKFSGYWFYTNTNVKGDLQIYLQISLPLTILQNSQENTCARVSFSIKLQASRPQIY